MEVVLFSQNKLDKLTVKDILSQKKEVKLMRLLSQSNKKRYFFYFFYFSDTPEGIY